ncbi:MKI67 FHA domain-interacting nucleolar phosphoprotein-like isoform X2 [Condylostylus longicornis]|uniref:MKI67 FHA domain-interacting nucleolar phosphoprotein-like isoform X2 n=1 Tax=Condylostylus longicornis TaxID=2530218 RepID=UPI00244DAC50|nr:MKI67 FHA domain-interacting nucleolar phosphoprotein-like isoform X2 [Condylostylus longicornis]
MAPIAKNKKHVKKNMDTSGEKVISAQLQKKMDQKGSKKSGKKPERGVVLLRHIPKGFFEDQMKDFFSQFGEVTRVRLARSRRTGGPKCFAFIEFKIPEVAQIVAVTMDNYIMFQKLVKAYYISPEEQKYDYFRTKVRKVTNPLGKSIFTSRKMVGKIKKVKKHNTWNSETYNRRISKTLKKLAKIKDKYSDLELDLDSVVIKPKLAVNSSDQSRNEEKQHDEISAEELENKPGSLLLVKKRKLSKNEKNDGKRKKTKPSLEQLLGDTINDSDSSFDEDYLPIADYNPNETLEIPSISETDKTLLKNFAKELEKVESESESDESYKPSQDSGDDDENYSSEEKNDSSDSTLNSEEDSENENKEEYEDSFDQRNNEEDKKTKTNYKKSKLDKENRLDNLIRRKPLSGGITKISKKSKLQKKNLKEKISEIVKNKDLKKLKKFDLKGKKTIS